LSFQPIGDDCGPRIIAVIQWLRVEFPVQGNREFSGAYQGSESLEQGPHTRRGRDERSNGAEGIGPASPAGDMSATFTESSQTVCLGRGTSVASSGVIARQCCGDRNPTDGQAAHRSTNGWEACHQSIPARQPGYNCTIRARRLYCPDLVQSWSFPDAVSPVPAWRAGFHLRGSCERPRNARTPRRCPPR
jgi:hypothetical protein